VKKGLGQIRSKSMPAEKGGREAGFGGRSFWDHAAESGAERQSLSIAGVGRKERIARKAGVAEKLGVVAAG